MNNNRPQTRRITTPGTEQTAESTKAPFSVGGAMWQGAGRTFRITADPQAIASSEDFILAVSSASEMPKKIVANFSFPHFGSGHPDVETLRDICQVLSERLFPRRSKPSPSQGKIGELVFANSKINFAQSKII